MHSLLLLVMFVLTLFTLENTEAKIIPFIVGGAKAEMNEFPHHVLIQASGSICGGSLISSEWVLTAAHCLEKKVPISAFYLKFGTLTLQGTCAATRNALRLVIHKDFKRIDTNLFNDIGLIMIPPLEFSDAVKPIQLPACGQPLPKNVKGKIVGFGKLNHADKTASAFLMKAEISYIESNICIQLRGKNNGKVDTATQLCYGNPEGGVDSCQGDSGGSLIVEGLLRGIVSSGVGCALPNTPGIYTNVASYRPWIKKVSGV